MENIKQAKNKDKASQLSESDYATESAVPAENKAKKQLSTNPIKKGANPIAKTLAKVETKAPVAGNQSADAGIIARINNFNTQKTTNKLYSGYINNTVSKKSVNFLDLIENLHSSMQNKSSVNDLFLSIHNLFKEKLNCAFTAFGMFQEKSNCINLKLMNQVGSTYSSKIFLSDDSNPVVECFKTTSVVSREENKFLNIPYLQNSSSFILPLMSVNKCLGVMIVGMDASELSSGLFSFIANYSAMFMHNKNLMDKANKLDNTDTLTSLYNHRGFQEILTSELVRAKDNGTHLSVIMMDVNNISKINRELGHAKGDEVIKLLAEKVKQNVRTNDKAGRYGGDEIAIILPDTTTADAKYLAEYITYTLSCCFVDDVGPVKVSVGISTFPDCTQDKEKLLVLAEQAMYISQAKGYKEGMSAIISTSDFNFWDNEALNSFAEVLAKRHGQMGINFEEELVHKFNSEQIVSQNHLMEMVTSLAGAIDAKDPYTKGHSTSVSRYSEALARAVNLPEDEVQRITLGALLHDVGKIGIPENVLKKPSNLSDDEWEIMKQHPVIGAEKVLAPNEALRDLIPMVKYHHEHIDGTGYPDKLKGEEIPLSARIVSVADSFHALISDRPYRKGLGVEKACEILKMGAGTQWDSDLVRHFITIAPSLSTII